MADQNIIETESEDKGNQEQANGSGQSKRILRSVSDRYIAGVCGGFAEYFKVDPLFVRILWFVSIFVSGVGLFSYIAAWIIIPENQRSHTHSTELEPERSRKLGLVLGLFLIFVGLLFLSDNLAYHFMMIPWRFRDFDMGILVSVIVIGLGAYLILNKSKSTSEGTTSETGQTTRNSSKKLTRSVVDRKVSGVCGGLAKYFDIDPTLTRIGTVVLGAVQPLLVVISYFVMILVIPEDTNEKVVDESHLASM